MELLRFLGCKQDLVALASAVLLALGACAYGPTPETRLEAAPALSGVALLPAAAPPSSNARRVHATSLVDVAVAATVSLIDPTRNITVATALTDSSGRFIFSFGNSFFPGATAYILEAVKGLGGHTAGNPAVRVRTVIKFEGGAWQSMTVGGVTVNRATTALAIAASLRGTDVNALLGKVQAVANGPSTFDPTGTGLTQADYDSVLALVDDALEADRDPVEAILYSPAKGYYLKAGGGGGRFLAILEILPVPVGTGGTMRILGENLAEMGYSNLVLINDSTASVTEIGSSSISVLVPEDARSGVLTVRNALGAATASLEVIPSVGGDFSPRGESSAFAGPTPAPAPPLSGEFIPFPTPTP